MTTAKQQPATPYDAEYEQLDKRLTRIMNEGGDDFITRHNRAVAIGKREGWLHRDADLAPLHRQLVEALEAADNAMSEVYRLGLVDSLAPKGEASSFTQAGVVVRAALVAARKAGL